MSADSVVPGAGNPQSYDRFSYVQNNPLSFRDPTGHLLCSEVPWEEDCDENSDGQVTSVARRGGLTGWGEHMLELFLEYRRTPGWWNQDGDFTLEKILGLTLYYEFADTPSDGVAPFTEAAGRKISWWCQENGCSNDMAAVLNYIGTRQVMRDRYNDWKYEDANLKDVTKESYRPGTYGVAIGMAQNALNNPAWQSGEVGYNIPWDWGNLSMFPADVRAVMANIDEFSLAVNAVIYRYGDNPNTAFVIFSYNQEKYWKSGSGR